MGGAAVSDFYLMTRAAYAKLSAPIARAALKVGLTPDSVTIIGTAGSVLAALTLFPAGQLFVGWLVIWFFVLADMLDGAMARERGGGTRFGAVLDATCDRISDGAVFCGLLWWAAFGLQSSSLVVATLICLVTSQVISYIKARAEASGLDGGGGLIERPERLVIALGGAGISDLPLFPMPMVLHVAMWVLAVASLVTVGPAPAQRADLARRHGQFDPDSTAGEPSGAPTSSERLPSGENLTDWGYAAGWRLVRAMPEPLARSAFDAGARYAARGGGPEQLRKNLARVIGTTPAGVPDSLMRAALASYARYWREAFRLPSMDLPNVAARLDKVFIGAEKFAAAHAAGRGAVMALPHSGNWDMAGVWLAQNYGTFTTVAERLKPESLYDRFIEFRESLGFEVLPLTGGARPPMEVLAERLRANRFVCLMADRDLTRSGVPVRVLRRTHPDARRPGQAGDRDRCSAASRARLLRRRGLRGPDRRRHGHLLRRRRRHHPGAGRPVRDEHRRPSRRTGTCCSRCGWPTCQRSGAGPTSRKTPDAHRHGVPVLVRRPRRGAGARAATGRGDARTRPRRQRAGAVLAAREAARLRRLRRQGGADSLQRLGGAAAVRAGHPPDGQDVDRRTATSTCCICTSPTRPACRCWH